MRAATNLYANLSDAMQSTESNLEKSINQISSGKRISNPSDDPWAFAQDIRSLSESASVDRYTKNADAAMSEAQLADSALSAVVSSLTSAVSLVTEGGDPTLTETQRNALAQQVQGILQSVVAQANTTLGGVALFGGTSGVAAAFVPDPVNAGRYLYQGNSASNSTAVGEALNVSLNVPGDQIFTSPGASTLDALEASVSALKLGDPADLASASTSLSAAIAQIGQIRAVYGSTVNQLTTQTAFLSQESVTLSSQQQSLVGADIAASATQLTQAQVAHDAVLAVAAKILPQSLLNYLH